MSNIFLSEEYRDVETALMLEKATVTDIGSAVAYTDGKKTYVNTEENLAEILPAYNVGMLKWLLWHERFHIELKHHNRFFKYLSELRDKECKEEFGLSQQEVNIIMDILVHDSLSKMFPELVETALANLAQMRNRNSLGYTFKTFNLEDMLDEYRKHKDPSEEDKEDSKDSEESKDKDSKEGKDPGEGSDKSEQDEDKKDKDADSKGKTPTGEKGHEGGGSVTPEETKDRSTPVEKAPAPEESEHDKTDWSQLDKIDDKEFITEDEAKSIDHHVAKLKNKKIKLGRLTQRLNSLSTTARERTYRMPSYIQMNKGMILKGKQPGKTDLYLVFDASGSMGRELQLFKDLITKSIPQAMDCPCEWFSGYLENEETRTRCLNKHGRNYDYYKGKFRDIINLHASSGYSDDGDRTIELCLEAEKKGFTPIGVTDGGGRINDPEALKQLKRTILVGPRDIIDYYKGKPESWLDRVKRINPNVQVLELDEE